MPKVNDRRRRKNQPANTIIKDVIYNKPPYWIDMEEDSKFVEIILEKYYNNNLNEINDFDAVFSYMLKSENIDRLKYGNHGYLINTIKAFPVPKFSGIYFQLMETKKNSTNTGVQNVSYATIRVCSKTLSMKGLKLLIVPSNCCSNNKSYRKILF